MQYGQKNVPCNCRYSTCSDYSVSFIDELPMTSGWSYLHPTRLYR